MAEMYSIAQLRQMIELARDLNFNDDVAHWQAELDRRLANG